MSSSNESHEHPVVGFLGLGAIGRPMAERICANGYRLVVYDVRATAMEPFRGLAELATSPADVAHRAEIVLGCLASSDSFRSAVLDPATGVIAGQKVQLYLHLGTNGATLVRELGDGLAARGIATIDVPMTGGVTGARKGTLTAMAAGPRAAFDRAEPVIRCYATKVAYLGETPGLGQAMKVVNNMMSLANTAVACEALVVGTKAGLDPETMLDVVNHGSGQSNASLTKIPRHVLPRSFDFGGALHVVIKDIRAFLEQAGDTGVATPLGSAVLQAYLDALAAGTPQDDLTRVIVPMERAAGVQLGRAAE
jgi:3-hydroxyisobutyrate dehydrogenase-like beta-hydroxyacid dehydrogenase